MVCRKIPFDQVGQFSAFDHLYAREHDSFKDLLAYMPDMDSIGKIVDARKKMAFDRKTIHSILIDRYRENGISGREELIDSLLDENTFTVVTAHQPYLFGGPLYFILKILSTVKLAAQAKDAYPQLNFVPVFYIGGEDHDLDECNHVTIFGKKVSWTTSQIGPVGRMTTDDLDTALNEVQEILGNNENALYLTGLLKQSYAPGTNINRAISRFIDALLKDFPLLILDADSKIGKEAFKGIIREEVMSGVAESLIHPQQELMKNIGLKPQAFVRPINFFYFNPEGRNRIERAGEGFEIVNTSLHFTVEEMECEIDLYPERFSPNVVMRPLYEEFLLPNVAYVGGGGELAYWADRKLLFEHFGVPMPLLVRRDSMMVLDGGSAKRMYKLGVDVADLFKEPNTLRAEFLARHAEGGISLSRESAQLSELIREIQAKVAGVDPSLKGFVGAETSVFFKTMAHIEARFRKSLSAKHDVELQQLASLQQKFFPDNGLQERVESFLSFFVREGNEFFRKIYECADPLDFQFKILEL
ncbi:MAG TPA: bacillithiol biosynthesis cysteine-adding enzyme BshC [Saprospiraceae bacterium]|nr:bacillithiol biosynthesis cysteine-adding enzyme BshC [Saprospiraceae bacterium]